MLGHRPGKPMLAILAVAVIAALAVMALRYRAETAARPTAEMSQVFVTPAPTPAPTPEPTATPAPTPTPEPTATPVPVVKLESSISPDFEALQQQNADVYAWLDIPGTDISYPMLQSEEDNYYLMRNLDGSQGYPGCIYTNACDPKDFSGFNTCIYGHNMRDGSMFGSLHKFFQEEFFHDHRQIVIYTPEEIRVYRVVSASVYDDRYIPAYFDYTEEAGRQDYLDSIRERAYMFAEDRVAGVDDHIITLCTCNGNSATRDVFVAVYEGRGEVQ